MNLESFETNLTTLQRSQPFQPFTIEMNGDRQIEIDSPFAFLVSGGNGIFMHPNGHWIMFDHESVNTIHTTTRAEVKKADAEDAA